VLNQPDIELFVVKMEKNRILFIYYIMILLVVKRPIKREISRNEGIYE